jgi:hypothetical protein
MFETLDSINWDSVQGCYGPASDVPRFLREMASCDGETRRRAESELWNVIWHQGTIYEATPLVVPFLFELLEPVHLNNNSRIPGFLATLGCSTAPLESEPNDSEFEELERQIYAKQGLDYDVEALSELECVRETRARVGRRLDLLLPFLEDNDRGMRDCIAKCLGSYPERASNLIPLLRTALAKENDQYARKTMQESIERLSKGT